MKTKPSVPAGMEVEAAALFYFMHFLRRASITDVRIMLDALFAWSKHPEIDGWFLTSVQQLCGQQLRDTKQEISPKRARRKG